MNPRPLFGFWPVREKPADELPKDLTWGERLEAARDAVADEPEAGRSWRTIAEETGELSSYPSYGAAKRALGSVPGMELHHLVEQCQAQPERSGFNVERLNTTDNLTRIPIEVHRRVSGEYSTAVPFVGGQFRGTLNGLPWEDQYEAGARILNEVLEELRSDGA